MSHAAHEIGRRTFLRRMAAIGFPAIIPASALGLDGTIAPSNRIALGLIGCGGRMDGVWGAFANQPDIQPVAICDVWTAARESYRRRLQLAETAAHIDFRELVARADVDAVLIATPDHWHVPMSVAAMRAGKDVYCEKPLSNTIGEGRVLVETARRYGAVFQHGTQLHSLGNVRRACELVRNGRIGRLREIHIGSPPGHATGPAVPEPVPAGLAYDLWLGPAPEAPYCAARVTRQAVGLPGWYFVSDYSKAGWIAGYGVHDLDIAHWGMGVERSGPVSISGRGVYPSDGLYDTVLTFNIEYTYANGVKIVMTDTGRNRHGVKFIGDKGWIFTRGELEAEPASILREEIGPGETHLYRSPDHARNFLDCIRTRGETITPPEIAHRATSAALLGGLACQLGRTLRWDPATERFHDDDTANGLLRCAMRGPWQV